MNVKIFEERLKELDYPTKEDSHDKEAYAKKIREYNEEKEKIVEAFKRAIFEEHGVENNPKKELLFEKACDNAYGMSQLAINFDNLVELIQ